ncbi:MAG TPA: serine hydrolase domain-containing protein [Gemmatimonadaceae bacterium]|jgi:CubicO group peptidase (beta-lactamase class C family)|nr:serine hydrolase domain-containing protein [Gemmatimonadaceae bacterium]
MIPAAPAATQTVSRLNAIARAQADSGFSGVVLVARDTVVMVERAYSSRPGNPITTQSQFNIGSITKSFTAAAILRLRSQHKLSFSDPITRFFPYAPAPMRGITVFHLLTHTSGIRGHSAGSGIVRRDGAVNAILAQPLDYPPGTQYRYMDDDYQLLAAIIEVASGLTWEDYLTRELLQPARMWSTSFQGGDWGHKGANGMRSTARDMYRWLLAIHHGRLFGRAESRELEAPLMHVRSQPPFEIHYGYGTRIYIRNGRVAEVMHSGSGDANNTSIARLRPDGTIVIVLSNAGNRRGSGTTWASYVAQKLVPLR